MNAVHVLAFVGFALLVCTAANPDKNSLEKFCGLRKDASEVTTLSEVKSIIALLKDTDQGINCPSDVKSAILALESVIELGSVCSEVAAQTIVGFWQDYVKAGSKFKAHLPRPLRRFFLAFGNQVSKVCKRTMIAELEKVSNEQGITEQDINIVTESIKGNINDVFGADANIEDLLALIQAENKVRPEDDKATIDMEPRQKKYFELIQERCVKKFKPIYDTLIVPVVRLTSIGMNYKSDLIDAELASFQQQKVFKDWFAAVLACQTVADYRAVVIPKTVVDTDGNTQMITFLDDDDLEELKKKTGLTFEEPALEEPADYEVEIKLRDLVVDEADRFLMESINNHGFFIKEVNEYRLRMIKKMPALLKKYIQTKAMKLGLLDTRSAEKQKKFGGITVNAKLIQWIIMLITTIMAGGIIGIAAMSAVASGGAGTVCVIFVGVVLVSVIIGGHFVNSFETKSE